MSLAVGELITHSGTRVANLHPPRGNDRLGPAASLDGRDIGQDFAGKDGWRMYHGDVVPGFPGLPRSLFASSPTVADLVRHVEGSGASDIALTDPSRELELYRPGLVAARD